jgi:hypothetical protein
LASSKRIVDAGDRRLLETKLALLRTRIAGTGVAINIEQMTDIPTIPRTGVLPGQGNKLSSKGGKIG